MGVQEAVQVVLDRSIELRGLVLERSERAHLALGVEDLLHGVGADGSR